MSDKELLELAAKAYWSDNDDVSFSFSENDNAIVFYDPVNQDHNGRDVGLVWNPLTDDGDALRLAVMIALPDERIFSLYFGNTQAQMDVGNLNFLEEHENDPYASTRRAIVRAAAAIGEKA